VGGASGFGSARGAGAAFSVGAGRGGCSPNSDHISPASSGEVTVAGGVTFVTSPNEGEDSSGACASGVGEGGTVSDALAGADGDANEETVSCVTSSSCGAPVSSRASRGVGAESGSNCARQMGQACGTAYLREVSA
jgi:hypothetical protein